MQCNAMVSYKFNKNKTDIDNYMRHSTKLLLLGLLMLLRLLLLLLMIVTSTESNIDFVLVWTTVLSRVPIAATGHTSSLREIEVPCPLPNKNRTELRDSASEETDDDR